MKELPAVKCDRWRGGICLAVPQAVTYCPRARAENAAPGMCSHHPIWGTRPMLAEMKAAGLKMKRYGVKLRDPEFVARLYTAFRKARSKRSTKSSKTSSKS